MEILLLFENVKQRVDDARKCMLELVPCLAKRTKDNNGLIFKKEYVSDDEYENIKIIQEKYKLKNL